MKTTVKKVLTLELEQNECEVLLELVEEGFNNIRNMQAGKEPQRENYTEKEMNFINTLAEELVSLK